MREMMKKRNVDVVVIGGGQAGIAIGHELEKLLCHYLILDNNERVGDAWRKRYDSLKLFTSRAYCQLSGMKMTGDQVGYPSKDEMADYLEAYAKYFELPIKNNCTVTSIVKQQDKFIIQLNDDEQITARAVIVAAGGFQVPKKLESVEGDIPQFTVNDYRNPANLPNGSVLVVGDGATGRQIALELSETREVILATGKKRNLIPQRVFRQDIFYFLDKIGVLWARSSSPIAKIVRKRDPFPGKHLNLKAFKAKGIKIVAHLKSIQGKVAKFTDGNIQQIGSVVWASGYKNDTSWIKIENAIDDGNQFKHQNGVSPVAGLYYIGLPWQSCRASALITGLEKDSIFVSKKVGDYLLKNSTKEVSIEQPVLF